MLCKWNKRSEFCILIIQNNFDLKSTRSMRGKHTKSKTRIGQAAGDTAMIALNPLPTKQTMIGESSSMCDDSVII